MLLELSDNQNKKIEEEFFLHYGVRRQKKIVDLKKYQQGTETEKKIVV